MIDNIYLIRVNHYKNPNLVHNLKTNFDKIIPSSN